VDECREDVPPTGEVDPSVRKRRSSALKKHFQAVYGGGGVEDLEMAWADVMEKAGEDLVDAEVRRKCGK
jgi:hypothetical protein